METDVVVRIETSANLMLLRPLDEFVRSLILQHPDIASKDDLANDLELVFNEAFMNILDHAYRSRPNGPVWIRVVLASDRLEFEFEDEGEGFSVRNDSVSKTPDVTQERGRGVWLIRRFMDEFSYQPACNGRNVLRLVKYFPIVENRCQK